MSSSKLSSQKIPKRGEVAKKANDRFAAADSDPGLSESQTVTNDSRPTESSHASDTNEHKESTRPKIARRETTRASFSLYKSDVQRIRNVRLSLLKADRERHRSDIVRLALAALDDMSETELQSLDDRMRGVGQAD